jgi:hypothetical protein
MKTTATILVFLAGAGFGVAGILSCSDSPKTVDAATTCDCPPAETPIAGRVMTVVNTQVIPANTRLGQGMLCPDGSQLISGSCTVEGDLEAILEQSGFDTNPIGWECVYKNPNATPITIKVTGLCLVPPS